MIRSCLSHLASGELQVLDSMISYLDYQGKEEVKIRKEIVRSAPLMPSLFARHNILKVSDYTSGSAWWPKQKLILFNGNVTIRQFHMYKPEH